jgi:hypothetical protein
MAIIDSISRRRLAAYLNWVLAEVQRETAGGEVNERANELIAHAEAVAERFGGPSEFDARLRELTRSIKRH